jgi:hypothetical protein
MEAGVRVAGGGVPVQMSFAFAGRPVVSVREMVLDRLHGFELRQAAREERRRKRRLNAPPRRGDTEVKREG